MPDNLTPEERGALIARIELDPKPDTFAGWLERLWKHPLLQRFTPTQRQRVLEDLWDLYQPMVPKG
jgi:hypothetical protein